MYLNNSQKKPLTHFSLLIFLHMVFFLMATLNSSFAQEEINNQAISTYQNNRQVFLDKQKENEQRFDAEAANLERDVESLQERLSNGNAELSRLKSLIYEKQNRIAQLNTVQTGIAFFLFPLAATGIQTMTFFLGDWVRSANLPNIFLVLTIVNIFLYLTFRQKRFFTKYRIAIIAVVIVFLASLASPLFAADELTSREKVINQLELAEKVLSLTDHERFIQILESKMSDQIYLPELAPGDRLLPVFRKVQINTPEYYFTLASLYMHEGQTGKAVEAVEQIVISDSSLYSDNQTLIAVNAIKFLINQKEQTELAGKAVESLADNIIDVSKLIELAEFLRSSGMQVSEEKVLGYAIERADTVGELVQLSTFLLNKEEDDKGTEALEQALNKVRSIEELVLVAQAAINARKDNVIQQVITKTKQVSNYEARVKISDLFLEHQRKEEAVAVFSEMIRQTIRQSPDNIKKLLFLIDAALQRNFLAQATNATKRLFIYLGPDGHTFPMEAGQNLQSAAELPNQDKINLPQFYGMLNEELGFNDKAEDMYIRNILNSLEHILKSYGYELPESLNDYHLLGRVWVNENRGALIEQLDRVYTIIEEQFLKQQSEKHTRHIEQLRSEVQLMESQQESQQTEMLTLEKKVNAIAYELTVRTISVIAIILLLLCIMIGCAVIAYRYAKEMALHKTFAFITKFLEATGWVRVFSVLGLGSGLVSIFTAQFLQIPQRTQENTLQMVQSRVETTEPDKKYQ